MDRQTGEIRPARAEPDAGLHFEGTGETAWGLKWVIAAVRSEEVHGRIILDTGWVPSPGGGAAVAMDCFRGIAARCPGAMGVIYDTTLRGVHHQTLLRNRTENVRPIPPSDPDFQRLYRRRNDAESINRALDDTLFLRRRIRSGTNVTTSTC